MSRCRASMIPHSRPEIGDAEIEAVVEALQHGRLSQGLEVAALEAELSGLFDEAEVVVVSSGTAALYLSLAALGIRTGDKVVIPSYTCNSLYAAVALAGARPICADIAEDGLSITRATVEPLLDDAAGAVIVPHTCGFLADIEAILELGSPVIEDCAQAAGGYYPDGTAVGSKGDIAVLSFFATKLLPAGEGGACITRDPDISETIRQLRNCDERPLNPKAFNFKMSDIHAALARAQLKRLSKMVKERSRIAGRYDSAFGNRSFRSKSRQTQAVCFRYIAETEGNLEELLKQSESAGIVCRRPIWRPLHHSIGGHCPETESMEQRLVSVPIYPGLSEAEIEKICTKLPEILK